MKNVKLIIIALFMGVMGAYAQSSSSSTTPTNGAHLGWDDAGGAQLRITQNNTNRMLFNSLDTWNGLNGETADNVSRITLGHNGESNLAWSMLHLWEGTLSAMMQRNWLNVGTSYTGNSDFMYTGLLERPRCNYILKCKAFSDSSDAIVLMQTTQNIPTC